MRPLRLVIEGFGSYRERTELLLSDVDFFVLTGPTGSGKSTVIDALCFALYGTVPRWGKGNVIRNALAPSTAECRVCVVFEASGARYAAARQLRRDVRGNVHTKEARLDRLDDSVPVDGELTEVLERIIEPMAEGPDDVTTGVTELLGIGYEHFTQCVLLPQGRFAEFLQAKPGDRQDLLIELLAYAVYEQVGQRARERGKVAAAALAAAEGRRANTPDVTDDDIAAARRRVADLDGLVEPVADAVTAMATLRTRWTEANDQARQARAQVDALAGLRVPDGTAELAERLAAADRLITERDTERQAAEAAETVAEQACAALADRSVLIAWRDDHATADSLREDLTGLRAASTSADETEEALAGAVADAEKAVATAEQHARDVDLEHRAAALAADLHEGEPCPVCRQVVGTLPHHDVAADVGEARKAVDAARSAFTAANRKQTEASKRAAGAKTEVETAERRLAELTTRLADAPSPDVLAERIQAREQAEAVLAKATTSVRTARRAVAQATADRTGLAKTEQRAWSMLRASRDGVATLQPPAVDDTDLALGWQTLVDWAAGRRTELVARATELDAAEADLRDQGKAAASALVARLAEHGVDVAEKPADAPVRLATHRERADRDLVDLIARQQAATELAAEIAGHREAKEVADLLGNLLRSNQFEAWLCAEALDSLVLEASETLMQLSGGQFELHRGDRNELVVIDHNDAGTHRPVNTLSGGETFQASLSLALALSRQVVGLSGGRRDLNSMFLDEGFGTLDEATLDTVAATLEKLAEETDRMVGIVTHVPALAERVPVQFAVRRTGASSTVSRVGV
ncbi:MAG TPA: SMC family ATPase [Pseudonocardiaceae bacterium]|nr:SMC family ATPase [Pseudonocardiaceae bacterium]